MRTFDEYIEHFYDPDNSIFDDFYDKKISEAEKLVEKLFEDKTDKAGVPYIQHLKAVASLVSEKKRERLEAAREKIHKNLYEDYIDYMMGDPADH